MSWNYRIVKWDKDPDGNELAENAEPVYAIHEVYYNKDGKPCGRTSDPDGPVAESPEELIQMLEIMLHDAKKHEPLIEPITYADPDFDTDPDPADCSPVEDLLKELEE